jgi:regulatory protein
MQWMKKALSPKDLYLFALSYLARREHSTLELTKKLKSRTDNLEWIPEIISLLTEKKLLSDQRFAESYARARVNRGYGKLRIQAELKERGILLDKLNIKTDIKKVREKKFGETLPIEIKEKAKQARYLQYKGFSFDEIKRVLKNDDDE